MGAHIQQIWTMSKSTHHTQCTTQKYSCIIQIYYQVSNIYRPVYITDVLLFTKKNTIVSSSIHAGNKKIEKVCVSRSIEGLIEPFLYIFFAVGSFYHFNLLFILFWYMFKVRCIIVVDTVALILYNSHDFPARHQKFIVRTKRKDTKQKATSFFGIFLWFFFIFSLILCSENKINHLYIDIKIQLTWIV